MSTKNSDKTNTQMNMKSPMNKSSNLKNKHINHYVNKSSRSKVHSPDIK